MNKRVENIDIFFKESGSGNNIILLLHGWGQSHAFWTGIIKRFSKKYHTYVLDLPGFGLSQEPPSIWDVKDYAIFLHKFISSLHITTPIIIGHSFGGRIASVYASQYPVKKLVLYSNGGLPQSGIHKKLYRYLFVKVAKHFFPNFLYKSHTTIFKPKQYQNRIILNKQRSQRMLDIYSQPTPNLKEYLEKIKTKTLIIAGKNDFIVDSKMGGKLHKLVKNSRLVEIPRATHFAHLEKPEIFYKEIEKFLDES